MSLRAIKKRENQLIPNAGARTTLFKKSTTSSQQRKFANQAHNSGVGGALSAAFKARSTLSSLQSLQQQRPLLGRKTQSSPELRHQPADTLERLAHIVRTKSESDVSSCIGITESGIAGNRGLIGAKSEVCLKSISSHSYQQPTEPQSPREAYHQINFTQTPSTLPNRAQIPASNMLSGARSHRDLTQSAYAGSGGGTYDTVSPTRRRLSECSLNSSAGYSQRTSAMSGSAITLSSNATTIATDPNVVVRVPIIGYEVMEERARFTVYKLRVENPLTNDCWLVLRRYTDFVRLNTKLKQAFPYCTLMLPRKKIFGDNFNSVFLDNRVQGLQMFVNSIMAKEEMRRCKLVREFFCLDEPPSYSESMEECRAIFEAQEETIAHLKYQINNKNDLILSLQQKLRDELAEKEQLKEALNKMPTSCPHCTSSQNVSPTQH